MTTYNKEVVNFGILEGVDTLRELEIEILRFFTSIQNPLSDKIAWVLTFLGNETFYFIILPFIFLCISKTTGFRLLYVFLFSFYINSMLKTVIARTRPVGLNIEGINPLYVESAEVVTTFPHDSFPSGHAQGSSTLWGFIAYTVRRPVVWILVSILVFFISIARLYTGVHWPTDVIGGVILAVLIITIYHFVEKFIVSLSPFVQLCLAIIFPILLILIFPTIDSYKYAGFLFGAGIAYMIEKTYVQMKIPSSWGRRLVAYLIGFAGIFALQSGLKIVFPDENLFHAIRYATLGIWGILITPFIIVKTKLYDREW